MASNRSPEMEDDGDDDFFREVYGKEYTGPPRLTAENSQSKERESKRPLSGEDSDADDGAPDPNAVPTDFTSRDAKVWEAKAKAIERNWKKRKEEEMICKICGDPAHFTQGCPTTLGGGRKSADFFERVAARDKRVRALFTETVIRRLEKEIGCKIRMDEKFIFVSGKDRLILAKGVDAVHKLIQGQGEDRDERRSKSPPRKPKSRSPERHDTRTSYSNAHQPKGFSQERVIESRAQEGSHKLSRDSPKAHAKNGARHFPEARSKSPPRPARTVDRPVNAHDRYSRRDAEKPASNLAQHPTTLEELESEFIKRALEIRMFHDKEEDEENYRHREKLKELRESYGKKLESVRAAHGKQWEEFLQVDAQRRALAFQAHQMPLYGAYGGSGSSSRPGMDGWGGGGGGMLSSMSPLDTYTELQQVRREDVARAAAGYGRY